MTSVFLTAPLVISLVFIFRGSISIPNIIFSTMCSIELLLLFMVVYVLHRLRMKDNPIQQNISLFFSYLVILTFAVYGGIKIPLAVSHAVSALDSLAYIFMPFYVVPFATIGYLVGWIIETIIYMVKTKRSLSSMCREHINKFKFVYLIGMAIVVLSSITTLIGVLATKYLPSDIYYTAQLGDINKMARLIDKGVDINAQENDDYGDTPLHIAALHGKKKMFEFLISKGADINSRNKIGQMPLHAAARVTDIDMVSLLLKHGADINAQDDNGSTPLREVARKGDLNIVRLLIENGAYINLANNGGQTPIFFSVGYRHKDITKLLLESGARIDIRNIIGETVIDVAEKEGYKEIERILKQHKNHNE